MNYYIDNITSNQKQERVSMSTIKIFDKLNVQGKPRLDDYEAMFNVMMYNPLVFSHAEKDKFFEFFTRNDGANLNIIEGSDLQTIIDAFEYSDIKLGTRSYFVKVSPVFFIPFMDALYGQVDKHDKGLRIVKRDEKGKKTNDGSLGLEDCLSAIKDADPNMSDRDAMKLAREMMGLSLGDSNNGSRGVASSSGSNPLPTSAPLPASTEISDNDFKSFLGKVFPDYLLSAIDQGDLAPEVVCKYTGALRDAFPDPSTGFFSFPLFIERRNELPGDYCALIDQAIETYVRENFIDEMKIRFEGLLQITRTCATSREIKEAISRMFRGVKHIRILLENRDQLKLLAVRFILDYNSILNRRINID